MKLTTSDYEVGDSYLGAYDVLIGDKRTRETFKDVVYGIIGAESLATSRIARFSPPVGNDQERG